VLAFLYNAGFFLYETGFLVLALALGLQALALRRSLQALHLGAWWLAPAVSAAAMVVCAGMHFAAYHLILPHYLQTMSGESLRQMYWLKFIAMASIFGGGLVLAVGQALLLRKASR
jgi:hypothetical protein